MDPDPATHDLLRVETPGGRGYVACCSCGWRSLVATTAGVAGSLHDDHVAAETERSS